MVIQYCRLSSIYGEIFGCANMPTEVSVIDLTPERLYKWEAPIAHSNTQSGGCMRPFTALQETKSSSDLHTQKRRSRLWQITVFTWGRFPSKPALFYRNQKGVGAFKHYCISRYIKNLHFCPVSLPMLCGSDLSFWKPCLVRYRVRFTCDTHSPDNSSACSLHPPLREEFAAPPEDQLLDV